MVLIKIKERLKESWIQRIIYLHGTRIARKRDEELSEFIYLVLNKESAPS